MRLDLVTEPTGALFTLKEAKDFRRVSGTADDALVGELVVAATELFEEETARQVLTATWDYKLDRFPAATSIPIEIPLPPLQSITSITYTDSAGDSQTWSSSEYTVDTYAGPFAKHGVVYPGYNFTYPDDVLLDTPNSVTVRFVAGWGAASDVPRSVRAIVQGILGDLYEERESQLVGAIIAQNVARARALDRFRAKAFV